MTFETIGVIECNWLFMKPLMEGQQLTRGTHDLTSWAVMHQPQDGNEESKKNNKLRLQNVYV
jgi:hypothetical protein